MRTFGYGSVAVLDELCGKKYATVSVYRPSPANLADLIVEFCILFNVFPNFVL